MWITPETNLSKPMKKLAVIWPDRLYARVALGLSATARVTVDGTLASVEYRHAIPTHRSLSIECMDP